MESNDEIESEKRKTPSPTESEVIKACTEFLTLNSEDDEKGHLIVIPSSVFMDLIEKDGLLKPKVPRTFRGDQDFTGIDRQLTSLNACNDVLRKYLARKESLLKTVLDMKNEICLQEKSLSDEIRIAQKVLFKNFEKFDALNHEKIRLINNGPSVCDTCWCSS